VLGFVLYLNWGERRVRRLYYLAAWFFAAARDDGQGPRGLRSADARDVRVPRVRRTARRWKERAVRDRERAVRDRRALIVAVALPWYVAMYVRHGSPFTDRLIFHDMFNRAFHHVHDTNEGDDTSFRFYVWQLGYALFPWTGLAPLGLSGGCGGATATEGANARGHVGLLFMWFLFAFALFSFMGTKFHHYIFPAVPPVAMLIGIVLDDMLGARSPAPGRAAPTAGPLRRRALLDAGGRADAAGLVLRDEGGARTAPGSPSCSMGAGAWPRAGVGDDRRVRVALPGRDRATARTRRSDDDGRRPRSRMLAAGPRSRGAALLLLVARDLIIKPDGADQPGAIRLLQLFTYNYRRAWPDSLDFSAALTGFGRRRDRDRWRSRSWRCDGTRWPRCARSRSRGPSGASTST
jgi:hypothetical protein